MAAKTIVSLKIIWIMKKHCKIIVYSILCFIVFEFVAYHTYSAIRTYNRTLAQNYKLRKELREMEKKLDSFENPERQDFISYRAIKVR